MAVLDQWLEFQILTINWFNQTLKYAQPTVFVTGSVHMPVKSQMENVIAEILTLAMIAHSAQRDIQKIQKLVSVIWYQNVLI
jgi:hypothetical protein